MNLQAYYILHYGKEWLEWSLRSVSPFVDKIHIFYTPHPSHGTQSRTKECPDSRKELREIALADRKVVWNDVDQFYQEGQHRDHAVATCTNDGADLIMVVDGDEVWDPDDLDDALGKIYGKPDRNYGTLVNAHFWRGVNWVCRDACSPIRFINPNGQGTAYVDTPGFYHFGYAQSIKLVAYKMAIHGHRSEIRPRWFTSKFSRWAQGITDVHPTNLNFWDPVEFDRNLIAHLIGDHPYFNDDLV